METIMETGKGEKENLPTDSPVMIETTMPMTPLSAGMPYSPMNPNSNLSTSRRPPRKSTLTQQQKNQKRQRATQDQLMTLEVEFNKNPTPTAMVREQIAQEINMTERSVQIWFQNRRAKVKNIARKSIENGEDCGSIPESMRRHLAMQVMEGGKPFLPPGYAGAGMGSFGNATLSLNTDTTSGKVVIQHFNCRSLSVGTWRRVGQTQMDLIIFYSPEKACVTYYINNDSAGYKIEYPFAWIKNMHLLQTEMNINDPSQQQAGELVVELNRPPKFYMDGSGSGGFYECSDFTEDQQASQTLVHHLGGPAKVLASQLAKLISLESYQNRHLWNPALTISAPVSPIGHRPASQPQHMVHPHAQMHLYPEQLATAGLMGPPPPRGHKRQRSKSVPIAIDFSMLRQPTAPFLLQQPQQQQPQQTVTPVSAKSVGLPQEGIFAPVPQHHIHNPFSSVNSPGLSIDTSASYGMELRSMAGPVSATTVATTSEFGTPAFFGGAVQAAMGTPYSGNFLTVDAAAMIGTSNTPISHHGGDPIIADESPPFDGSSAHDIFSTPNDQLLSGDAMSLDMDKSMHRSFKSPLSQYSAAQFSSAYNEDSFDFNSPPPSSHKMDLPFRLQDHGMVYQTPTHQSQQLLQDSGIAFNSATDDQQMYHTPKEGNAMLNQDKMFQSPAPQSSSNYHTPANPQNYQTPMHQTQQNFSMQTGGQKPQDFPSPLNNGENQSELNLNNFLNYGTIDPTSL